jgi:hypothetical protein
VAQILGNKLGRPRPDARTGRLGEVALPSQTRTRRTKAHLVIVELLGEERKPANAGLCDHEVQAGVSLKDTGGHHIAHGLHAIPFMAGRAVGHEPTPLLAAYGGESLLGHVDITESWEWHSFLHSMALFRLLQNARDNRVHNQS